MPVITFGNTEGMVWGGAGWAFRQALLDLAPYARGDQEFLAALAQAENVGHLGIDGLEPGLRGKISRAIQQMCVDMIAGVSPSTITEVLPDDSTAHAAYREAIGQLLLVARAAERGLAP